tara:strand:+ start:451 stop:1701 length:1251 start_codon:yes stop_codon:yes gene_type:complete
VWELDSVISYTSGPYIFALGILYVQFFYEVTYREVDGEPESGCLPFLFIFGGGIVVWLSTSSLVATLRAYFPVESTIVSSFYAVCPGIVLLLIIIAKQIFDVSREMKSRVSEILAAIELSQNDLFNCDTSYREYKIRKKTGGMRTIREPNEQLKQIQKRLQQLLDNNAPINPCAHGFRKNRSVVSNAIPHIGNEVVIKLDIESFFDSVRYEQVVEVYSIAASNFHYNQPYGQLHIKGKFKDFIEKLASLSWQPSGLPQGASTSPVIANSILEGFDRKVFGFVYSNDGSYTRYADDITISYPVDNPKLIRWTIKFVEQNLLDFGFYLNKKKAKLNVLRPHQSQKICGITINDQRPTISRKDRKLLRAIQHRLKNNGEVTLNKEQISGLAAYYHFVMTCDLPTLISGASKKASIKRKS